MVTTHTHVATEECTNQVQNAVQPRHAERPNGAASGDQAVRLGRGPLPEGWFCGINRTKDLTCTAVDRWRRIRICSVYLFQLLYWLSVIRRRREFLLRLVYSVLIPCPLHSLLFFPFLLLSPPPPPPPFWLIICFSCHFFCNVIIVTCVSLCILKIDKPGPVGRLGHGLKLSSSQ